MLTGSLSTLAQYPCLSYSVEIRATGVCVKGGEGAKKRGIEANIIVKHHYSPIFTPAHLSPCPSCLAIVCCSSRA